MSDTATEHETLARALHADDMKHGRAFSDFEKMNAEAVQWYHDNADAVLAAGFRLRGCCSPPGDTTQCLDCPEQETEA